MKRVVAAGMFLALCSSAAFAGFDEGKKAYDANDYATALKEWQPLAEQGDARAQAQMARMYYSGRGVAMDKERALVLARQAAEKNEPYAQNLIGIMAEDGEAGLTANPQEGVVWYRKAAEQGLPLAQANLGHAYFYGKGVSRDWKEAEVWYRKAADQGFSDGEFGLGVCYVNHGIRDYVEGVK